MMARISEVATIMSLDSAYIECRALSHSWEEIPYDGGGPAFWKQTKSNTLLLFRCTRCSMRRYDTWSGVTGDLVDRAYRQPDNYSLPKGYGKKHFVRRAYLEGFNRPKGKASLRSVS
jgi:hypothetical protein